MLVINTLNVGTFSYPFFKQHVVCSQIQACILLCHISWQLTFSLWSSNRKKCHGLSGFYVNGQLRSSISCVVLVREEWIWGINLPFCLRKDAHNWSFLVIGGFTWPSLYSCLLACFFLLCPLQEPLRIIGRILVGESLLWLSFIKLLFF